MEHLEVHLCVEAEVEDSEVQEGVHREVEEALAVLVGVHQGAEEEAASEAVGGHQEVEADSVAAEGKTVR